MEDIDIDIDSVDININVSCAHCGELFSTLEANKHEIGTNGRLKFDFNGWTGNGVLIGTEHECFHTANRHGRPLT
jgi:hypothetical protein